MNGGPGTDAADYRDTSAGISIDLAIAGPQATGGSGNDSLAGVEDVFGGSVDVNVLRGDGGPNRLIGSGGADVLEGRGGQDVLTGGAGADALDVRDGGPDSADCGAETDVVTADAPGTDTLIGCESFLFPPVTPSRRRPPGRRPAGRADVLAPAFLGRVPGPSPRGSAPAGERCASRRGEPRSATRCPRQRPSPSRSNAGRAGAGSAARAARSRDRTPAGRSALASTRSAHSKRRSVRASTRRRSPAGSRRSRCSRAPGVRCSRPSTPPATPRSRRARASGSSGAGDTGVRWRSRRPRSRPPDRRHGPRRLPGLPRARPRGLRARSGSGWGSGITGSAVASRPQAQTYDRRTSGGGARRPRVRRRA